MKNILFDLDGTLTDPKKGIENSFRFALEKMGVKTDPEADYTMFIGPPLKGSFEQLLGDPDEEGIDSAIHFYREWYGEKGQYENSLYPGIDKMLKELSAKGYRLFLATSKLEKFAVSILEHFNLDEYFSGIYGSRSDGTRSDKPDLIAYILKTETLEPERTIMIGDRHYDITGAVSNGIRSVGVLWGYGSLNELETAGASAICTEIAELDKVIAGL